MFRDSRSREARRHLDRRRPLTWTLRTLAVLAAAVGTASVLLPEDTAPAGAANPSLLSSAVPGAMLPGQTAFAIPGGAYFVSTSGSDSNPGTGAKPFRTISAAVKSVPGGATIVVRAGTYRESVVFPYKKRLSLQAHPGEAVWLDGSSPVTGWKASDGLWFSDGWTHDFDATDPTEGAGQYWNMVSASYPMASHPEQVFLDGVQLRQVGSRAAVKPGTFFLDSSANRLYLGNNPAGHLVEASARGEAIYINHGDGSAVRGIGVRRFADSLLRYGAVKLFADDVTVEDLVVKDNATRGIGIHGHRVTLRRVTATGNGQLGIGADQSDRLLIEDSIVTGNNTERFNTAPVAGGIKLTSSRNGTVRGSTISDNIGNGLWLDESCFDFRVVSNEIERNTTTGMHLEISGHLKVVDNLVADNLTSGVRIAESNEVDVWNNTLVRNKQNLDVIDGPRLAKNTSTPGHDPRRGVDPQVTWMTSGVRLRNNLVINGRSGTVSLLGVEDGTRSKRGGDMVWSDYNAFFRTSGASPKWVVNWANYGSSPSMLVFNDLKALKAKVWKEPNGLDVVSSGNPFLVSESSGDYRTAVGSPGNGRGRALPKAIADAVGLPYTGTKTDIGRLSR